MKVPAELGRYRVQGELARGGMGVVYRGLAPDGAPVAIKVLPPYVQSQTLRQRFQVEIAALGRTSHPHIVGILDFGETDYGWYLVMPLAEGSLQERLKTGPLPEREAAAITHKLALALAYAHECGVIHRDVKPANVLFDREGEPLLSDFGLVKDLELGTSLSKTGAAMGTPGYWPPEQAAGDRPSIGPLSDVYALGATLYAMLCGGPPFQGGSPVALQVAAVSRAPAPPSRRRPGLDPELERICLDCLAKAPRERPGAETLARRLAVWLRRTPAPAGGEGGRAALAAGVLVAAGLVGAAATLLLAAYRSGRPAPPSRPAAVAAVPTALAAASADVSPPGEAAPTPRASGEPIAPQLVQALVNRGADALDQGDPERALRNFRAAIAADPALALPHVALAHALIALNRLDEALGEAERSVELEPNLPQAWVILGMSRAGVGQRQQGVQALDRALQLDPERVDALMNRGSLRSSLGDLEGGLEDLDRATALEPDNAQVLMNRGISRFDAGDFEGAAADHLRTIQLSPGTAEYYVNYAIALGRLGRYEESLAATRQALELDPQDALAWSNQGRSLQSLGRYEEALAAYDRALQLLPEGAERQQILSARARLAAQGD